MFIVVVYRLTQIELYKKMQIIIRDNKKKLIVI